MFNQNAYRNIAVFLLVLPCLFAAWKYTKQVSSISELVPREVYQVTYEFDLSNLSDKAFVSAYLPVSNSRQSIKTLNSTSLRDTSIHFMTETKGLSVKGKWKSSGQEDLLIQHQFEVEGKSVQFSLPFHASFNFDHDSTDLSFLLPSIYIQSDHPLIDTLAQLLKQEDILSTLRSNFQYVQQIENSSTGLLTDALAALKRQRASCNGKSRLFVALCRAQGIPARVAGGIVLENSSKRTSHLWAEIRYQDHWIPFDVLNNHFATLPANYLELYKGDHYLISHSKGIGFDYQFIIKKQYHAFDTQAAIGPQLWPLLSEANIPLGLLRSLLILPVAGVVMAICRNVVGLKSFGIFLPALIGLSLVSVSLWSGLYVFFIVILLISILHFLTEKWGLLHTPKLVIMLTAVVMTLLVLSMFGYTYQWEELMASMFLPVIVLAITAERFANILLEENFTEALKLLASTFFIAFLCYPLFKADVLIGFLLTFPELYVSILGLMILLGRWIGLRLMEYRRFAFLG